MKTRHLLALPALVASISLFSGNVSADDPNEQAEVDIFAAELADLQKVDLFDSLRESDFQNDPFAPTSVAEVRVAQVEVAESGAAEDPFAEPAVTKPTAAAAPRFTRQPSDSSVRSSRMSTAELRQARALYRAQQRTARLEYNLWMGYEPLRPNWNAVPMMSSRYSNRRIYVPMYVNPSR
jgi:hypothetical protein